VLPRIRHRRLQRSLLRLGGKIQRPLKRCDQRRAVREAASQQPAKERTMKNREAIVVGVLFVLQLMLIPQVVLI
jgi:hypothetical protein